MEMSMGMSCELTPDTDSTARSAAENPDFICPNCGHRMSMPESGGLHCRGCARYLPTPEQVQRVLNAMRAQTPVQCHHCQSEVAPRSVCSSCNGRLL